MIHTIVKPETQTVHFNIPKNYIGKELEIIAFERKEGLKSDEQISPALQGNPLTNKEFVAWVEQAESLPTISLQEGKGKWTTKRRQLQLLTK